MTPVITITERETQLTQMLRTCSEALQATTKERDDALYAGRLIVQRCDRLVSERDAYQRAADAMAMAHKVERDALALDAARYRWIVRNIVEDTMEVIEDAFAVFGDALGCTKAEFDAAIDAAIRSGEDK